MTVVDNRFAVAVECRVTGSPDVHVYQIAPVSGGFLNALDTRPEFAADVASWLLDGIARHLDDEGFDIASAFDAHVVRWALP